MNNSPSPPFGRLKPVDADLRRRVATAAVSIPLIVALVGWAPAWIFACTIAVVTLGALREFFSIVFPEEGKDQLAGILFGFGISLSFLVPRMDGVEPWLGVWLVLLFSAYVFRPIPNEERLTRAALLLLGAFYVGYLIPHWVVLFRLPNGRAWVFFVLFVVMMGDSVAYLVGRRFGRRKLAPELSPGKTVEGSLGYFAGVLIAGTLSMSFLPSQIHSWEVLLLSLISGVLGQLGDLFESLIKRVFAVKDAGALLPGHGGLLDRLDSLVFPVVFIATYLRIFYP